MKRRTLSAKTRIANSICAAAAALASAAAAAQDPAADPPRPSAGEDIVVSGDRPARPGKPPPDFPATVTVIGREELERTHPSSTAEVLQRVPGIVYGDEDGRGFKPDIGLRGLNPIRSRNVLILVDQVPIQPSMYGDPSAYYNVPVELLDRVEVIKGGGALLYGANTVGGVVNYVTRRPPESSGASLRTSYGSYNALTVDASLGLGGEKSRLLATYLLKRGDGFRRNLDYRVDDGSVRFDADLGPRDKLAVDLDYHAEDEGTAGGLTPAQYRSDISWNSTPFDRFAGRRFGGSIAYRRALGEGALRTTLYGNFFERNWYIAGTRTDSNDQFLRKFDVLGAEPRYTVRLGGFNQLTVGARAHADRMTDRGVRGPTPTARTGTTTGNAELSSFAWALYAQDELELGDRLKLTPGLRFESVLMTIDDYVKATHGSSRSGELVPALGASFRLAEQCWIFAGLQRSFKPPEFKEAIDPATGADRDLQAQRAWEGDLGVRAAPLDWLSGELSLFHVRYQNQIVNDGGRLVNAQDTRQQGVEGEASLVVNKLLRAGIGGDLSLHYGLTLLDATFRAGKFSGNRLPFAPRVQHTWSVRYARPSGLNASLDGRFVGQQFADSANTFAENGAGTLGVIPSYQVWSANLEYRFPRWGSIFASLKNLFDARYFTFRGSLAGSPGIFPSPGRTFEAGLSVRL